jgi:hypothetical protein
LIDGGKGKDVEQIFPVPMRKTLFAFWSSADRIDQEMKVGDGCAWMVVVQPTECSAKPGL